MLKTAKLEFVDLDDPEKKKEFILCTKATDLYLALWDIYYGKGGIRELIKYGTDNKSVEDVLEIIKDHFFNCLESRGLSLDMLE